MIGLSVDPVEKHASWAGRHRGDAGAVPNYPIIGDADLAVAKLYGMLRRGRSGSEGRTPADNQTVRKVFVIGPDKKVKLDPRLSDDDRAQLRRGLRVIDSLQLTAKHKVATPANWKQGDDVIIAGRCRTTRPRRRIRRAGRRRLHLHRAAARLLRAPLSVP